MATSNPDEPIKISKRIEKELHQTKVVIRRLPPDLTEEKLLETLSDVPPYRFFYFVGGDPSLGILSSSRAYFAFTDEASILPFRDKYDGLYLESEKGTNYRAVVEFAPYQGIPKRQKRKPDSRIATVEQDSDYQAFLDASEVKPKPPTMMELSAYIDTVGANKVSKVQRTPLIDYLLETHSRRGVRSGKRSSKSAASDSKKKHGREVSRSGKESRKDAPSSKGSKEVRGKREVKEGRERVEKKREDVGSSGGSSSKDGFSSSDKHREKSGREKKRQAPYYEENGEVRGERETKLSKESRLKNRDRPDQAIYSPRGKPRDYDRSETKEFGRSSKDKDSSHRHHSSVKDGSSEYNSRSGRSAGREYGTDEKPRRGRGGRDDYDGSKERRHEGGRRSDGYRKSKDSYYDHESTKTHSSGYREK